MSFFKNLFDGSFFRGMFRSQQPNSKDEFAAQLCREVTKAGETCRLEYDREAFQVRFLREDGTVDVTTSLQNVFAEYQQAQPDVRPDVMKRFLRGILSRKRELPDEYEDARPDIFPVVRSRFFSERLRLERRKGGQFAAAQDLLVIPLGDQFEAVFVYDLPDSMRFLTTDTRDDWDVTIYELAETAKQNLAELSTTFAGVEGQFYLCVEGDNYASSRILLTDAIRQLDVKGDWVAMVPNRHMLLVTGSEDPDGLKIMAQMAETAFQQPRPQGLGVLRLVEDEWETWFPPADSPVYAQYRKLELMSQANEYADQRDLLAAILEQEEVAQFVANYSVVQKQDGDLFSYCVWSEGVTALLPRAQNIVFLRTDERGKDPQILATVPWEKALQILEHRMEETEHYPPRWLIRDFPTPEEFLVLGNDPF